ncbi:hypothetical protein Asulf_01504 [Archaeoglobus sulfaticallidus PM70-1]|uniref:Uncharacterized protein n=1 Tax=Archaeoglobus sulfaticallidus PM70-1 TaxID=387631 RepID=N0BGU5_9EURY|nr:hypothetical protein [Archaeoglobus sulfaticallidus]AGK61487.1 hypothetical protein Asulf_01504 [Archaeoglobus sulfaticallidus PM70-1]
MIVQATLDWNFSAITNRRRVKFLREGVIGPLRMHIGKCQPHEKNYGYLICDNYWSKIIIHDALNSFKITKKPRYCKTCRKKSSGHVERYKHCWADRFYIP